MKFFCCFFVLILFNFSFAAINTPLIAYAQTESYAQVLTDNIYLYRTPSADQNINNLFFEIPRTYFVQITGIPNEQFYKATYLDQSGYVKATDVQCVKGKPKVSYLSNINFRLFWDNIPVYKQPASGETLSEALPRYCTDFIYYGKIKGNPLILDRTDTWYFCEYTPQNLKGYLYSEYVDKFDADKISINTEILPYISVPQFMLADEQLIDRNTQNAIIIVLSLPLLAFIILLFKGSAILSVPQKTKTKSKDKEINDFKY